MGTIYEKGKVAREGMDTYSCQSSHPVKTVKRKLLPQPGNLGAGSISQALLQVRPVSGSGFQEYLFTDLENEAFIVPILPG